MRKAVDFETFYSIGIVDNEIMDKQYVDTVVIDDHHQPIFWDMISDVKGSYLVGSANKGSVFIKVMHYDLPGDLNEENIQLISYVYKIDSNYSILQTDIESIDLN